MNPSPESDSDPSPRKDPGFEALVLVTSIFLAAGAGLVYELVAGTLSSYLLGDSITQFSIVIGLFLTAMGIGSWLSGKVQENLEAWFVGIELGAGLVGGFTALAAFTAFSLSELYLPVLLSAVVGVGVLVGFEIPLVVRILESREVLRLALARVMAADYLGALGASLLFPFLLLPHLGLVRAGLVTGMANVVVAGLTLWVFRDRVGRAASPLRRAIFLILLLQATAFVASFRLVPWLEDQVYQDEIVLAKSSAFQRIVVTRWRADWRLYLNGHLQFSSIDEYRYHEALVRPVMAAVPQAKRVLILGGGDGLAAREVLAHPGVEAIDLVDLDPEVTDLFRDRDVLSALSQHALRDPKVKVQNLDAQSYLETSSQLYDVVILDLPDPGQASLGKLYSRAFYRLVARHLSPGGALVTQATSPYRSREAFWCIAHTLKGTPLGPNQALGPEPPGSPPKRAPRELRVYPYWTHVPTFGTWGFVLAQEAELDPKALKVREPARYLSPKILPGLFDFPPDMDEVPTGVSRLDDPLVSKLYQKGYHRYLQ